MDHSQRDPRPQTTLNNIPDLRVQALGSGPSCPVQKVHHLGAVLLNQDLCATQPPLESLGCEEKLSLRKLKWREDWSLDQLHVLSKDCKLPPPYPWLDASTLMTWVSGEGCRGTPWNTTAETRIPGLTGSLEATRGSTLEGDLPSSWSELSAELTKDRVKRYTREPEHGKTAKALSPVESLELIPEWGPTTLEMHECLSLP